MGKPFLVKIRTFLKIFASYFFNDPRPGILNNGHEAHNKEESDYNNYSLSHLFQ